MFATAFLFTFEQISYDIVTLSATADATVSATTSVRDGDNVEVLRPTNTTAIARGTVHQSSLLTIFVSDQ